MTARIAFFSSRALGQVGTTGTYMVVKRLSEIHTVLLFSPNSSTLSVWADPSVPYVHTRPGFATRSTPGHEPGSLHRKRIKSGAWVPRALRQFDPHIAYIFASPNWPQFVDLVRKACPSTKIVLDVRSPYLEDRSTFRRQTKTEGDGAYKFVDLVLALSADAVATWFDVEEPTFRVVPLGVDVRAIEAHHGGDWDPGRLAGKPWNICILSTLHPLRRLDVLLHGLARFLTKYPRQARFHVIGDGPDYKNLVDLANDLGITNSVIFHGLVPQSHTYRMLADMDGGIAWVPQTHLDSQPSLKSLEYLASKLPVLATSTRGHLALSDQGISVDYCEFSPTSVSDGIENWISRGFSPERIAANFEAVQRFDFSQVIQDFHLPLIEDLVQPAVEEATVPGDALRLLPVDPTGGNRPKGMRILVAISSLAAGKGGSERIAIDLANNLLQRGHNVSVAYKDRGNPAYAGEARLIHLPYQEIEELDEIIELGNFDVAVLFSFSERTLVPMAALTKKHKVPFVVQECTNPDRMREVNWRHGQGSLAKASWEREVLFSTAARIRLVMPSYGKSVSGFHRPRVRAFPNACPIFSRQARPDVAVDGRWRIIAINPLKANKNGHDLIRAFIRVAPLFPLWDLYIIGAERDWGRPDLRELSGEIDAAGIWPRLVFSGTVEDVETSYADSHIHVISSLSEGCPTALLEAMAAGLPSVGFQVCSGTNELIEHEKNGLLVSEVDRVDGLTAALSRLMQDPELRRILGGTAYSQTIRFSSIETIDQWERLLTEAADLGEAGEDCLFRECLTADRERALHDRRMLRHESFMP